jgi:membrane dipeptidase
MASDHRVIADAHSDLLLELAHRAGEPNAFARHWLPQLSAGGVKLQICALTAHYEQLPGGATRQVLEQVLACYRLLRETPDVHLVASAQDLHALVANAEGRGLILALQGSEALGYSAEGANALWRLGVRVFALAWIRRNPFSDAVTESPEGGLSRLGSALLRRLDELGAILDLSHTNDASFEQGLEEFHGPVFVSHAGCRAINPTQRNLSDPQLRALAERDGVLGVMVLPSAIDPNRAEIMRVVDHIDHAVRTIGVDRVALGADFGRQIAIAGAIRRPPDSLRPVGMGLDFSIDNLAGPEHYPNLVAALEARGYDDTKLEAILSRNLIEFLGRSLPSDGTTSGSSRASDGALRES